MTLDTLIMFAGAAVAVLPFLGFPNSWDTVFFVILGIFVISLGIVVRRRYPVQLEKHAGTYIESAPAHVQEDVQ